MLQVTVKDHVDVIPTEIVKPKEIVVEEIEIKPKQQVEVNQLLGRPEVQMKFKEDLNVTVKEIKKEIDIEQNRVIINKTMKTENVKKSKDRPTSVGWIKPYVGKIDKE